MPFNFLQDLLLWFVSSWWTRPSVSTVMPSLLPRSSLWRRLSPMQCGVSSTPRPTPWCSFFTWWMLASLSLSGFGPSMPISRWIGERFKEIQWMISSTRWRSDLPIQSPAIGHTGWNSSTISTGWLTSQKYVFSQSYPYSAFSLKVYEHAHKLHHYLHGTLSFDAHIYGGSIKQRRPSERSCANIFRQRNARGVLFPLAWAWPWMRLWPHPSYPQQTGTLRKNLFTF